MLNNQVMTTKEAAEYLKINQQVLRRYLRKGEVPARKVGGQWRLNKLALDLWLAPSLEDTLVKVLDWKRIFALGDELGEKVDLPEDKIIE